MNRFLCSLLVALAACAPVASQTALPPREAGDPIVWNAPAARLEAVILPAIQAFDPTLRFAAAQPLGVGSREIVAAGLERRGIVVLIGETEPGARSLFTLAHVNGEQKTPGSFADRLEAAMTAACDEAFSRAN